ncbi:MAG: aminotransferase class I/II-fold pyridoxal phosphate-dependent enzyme [Flavobacteriaceae bacterium]
MTHFIETFPGPEIEINKKTYLYFGGTAYLGLQYNTEFQEIFKANILKYGTSYGASRKSNVRLSIYDEVERFLASWTGSEACVTLSSGYLAAQLVSDRFSSDKYRAFYAPNCHAALFPSSSEKKKRKPYITYTSLNIAVRQHLEMNPEVVPVILMDSIDFSGTNFPDFEGIKALPLEKVILIVDDSHGIGVVGPAGAGVYPILAKLGIRELLVCCSLGKAMGVQAGAIFCSQKRCKDLVDTDFYGGASPAAPAYMATLLDAREILTSKREYLKEHITVFSREIEKFSAISKIPDYPVYSYTDKSLTNFLLEHQIIVTDFSYPTEAADLTSRIVLSAGHESRHLAELSKHLKSYFNKG